jgi:prepilin-type N-terminal cleavage/methylation domain-containing protein/prepilin-type processing-associated H-X9-DG protein
MVARGFTLVELLMCLSIIALLAGLMLPAVIGVRHQARRAECANNLFQIGVALANYHDAHRTFPPGYISHVGNLGQDLGPGWGWATMILPFVEQMETYGRIRFDESADSEWNSKWTGQHLELFSCPADPSACSYVACYGAGDFMRSPDQGEGMFFRNSRVRLRDVDDGPMTIMIGERSGVLGGATWASLYIPTTPEARSAPRRKQSTLTDRSAVLGHTGLNGSGDPVHTPNKPSACGAGFGSVHPGGANFLLVDGSARFVTTEVDPNVFAGLATRAGRELVNATDF